MRFCNKKRTYALIVVALSIILLINNLWVASVSANSPDTKSSNSRSNLLGQSNLSLGLSNEPLGLSNHEDKSTDLSTRLNSDSPVPFADGIDTADKLQTALANASDGDILNLTADFSIPTVTITKNVTLRASEDSPVSLFSQGEGHFIINTESNIALENLILDGQQNSGGVEVKKGDLLLNNVQINNTTNEALYIKNSKATINNSSFNNNTASWGAGINIFNSSVTINNSTFSNNSATNFYYGGAVNIISGTVEINDSRFTDNISDYGGGAIAVGSDANSTASLNLNNSEFVNNSSDTMGGAVYLVSGTFVSKNNHFSNNHSEWGGAIYVNDGKEFKDSESEYISNSSLYSGGAIDVRNGASLELSNSNFINNTSDTGGAICGYSDSTITINQGAYSGNRADFIDANGDGGVIHVHPGVTLNIDSATFNGNSAYYNGGAISALGNSVLSIKNSNFTGNSSDVLKAGAVYVEIGTKLTLINNNFTENTALQGGAVYCYSDNDFTDTGNHYTDNIAANAGGAIFMHHDSGRVSQTSTFNSKDSIFKNNKSTMGGAIYVAKGIESNFHNASFIANYASKDGGAIFTADNDYSDFEKYSTISSDNAVTFIDNVADNGLYNPPQMQDSFKNIFFARTSMTNKDLLNPDHPINNYDINYNNDTQGPIDFFTVTFDPNGGTFDNGSTDNLVLYVLAQGSVLSQNTTKQDYIFDGWYTEYELINKYNFGSPVTENIILYAKWEPKAPVNPVEKLYTITYTDGVDSEEIFVNQVYSAKEGSLTPPFQGTPVRNGYKFIGWSPKVSDIVNASVTYTAQWTKTGTTTHPPINPDEPSTSRPSGGGSSTVDRNPDLKPSKNNSNSSISNKNFYDKYSFVKEPSTSNKAPTISTPKTGFPAPPSVGIGSTVLISCGALAMVMKNMKNHFKKRNK